jgi:hypothetical protein
VNVALLGSFAIVMHGSCRAQSIKFSINYYTKANRTKVWGARNILFGVSDKSMILQNTYECSTHVRASANVTCSYL